MLRMQHRQLPKVPDSRPQLDPSHNDNNSAGPPRRRSGGMVSVDFFDHPPLSRIDQVGSVFAMDVAVLAQRRQAA
jgi:hypothetical protein